MVVLTGEVTANAGLVLTGSVVAKAPVAGSTLTLTGSVTATSNADTLFLRYGGAWLPSSLYVRIPGGWMPASGSSTTAIMDPTATVISTRNYPAATPLVAGTPWEQVQLPRVRGTIVNRINGLTGGSVPAGSGGAPASCMKVELFAHSNNDVTATATAAATASATAIQLNTGTTPVFPLDFLLNNRTQEKLRATAVSGTTVTVVRATQTSPQISAAAIFSGDTFTINGGDVSDSGGNYDTSRSEVRGDYASPSSTAPSLWPHPVGSVRFFNWKMLLPSLLFPTPTGTNWVTVTQLKGQFGGSPPVSIEASTAGTFKLQLGNGATDINFGNLTRNVWHDITLGVKLSPDPAVGWVEMWFEGVNVIARRSAATMEYQSGSTTPDPIYLKQGIYREKAWNVGHTAYFGPLKIADSGAPFGTVLS